MTTKLIQSLDTIGIDPEEICANLAALVEFKEDVLRDLMRTSHAIERSRPIERGDLHHPRRRMCV